jgi:hypothetical protein
MGELPPGARQPSVRRPLRHVAASGPSAAVTHLGVVYTTMDGRTGNMLRRLILTAALTTALTLTGSGAVQAARCKVPASLRLGVPFVERISTTNVGCDVGRDVARGIIRRYDAGKPIAAEIGAPQPTFAVRAVRGRRHVYFTCRGRYVELNPDGDLAYELRCTQRTRMVRLLLYS